jgi:pimeloyl-ACP methyl ester carboxylesterase
MLKLILWISFIWVGLKIYYTFLSRRYKWRETADEIHLVRTADDKQISLYRYLPAGTDVKKLPLLLCHGFGANRYNLDLGEKHSFARYARDKGYDTWLVDLRGNGLSDEPAVGNHFKYDWTFEDYLHLDIPTAIETIKSKTGAEKIAWVGHSMGGMLLYAHVQETGDRDIACGVALASPGTFAGYPDSMRKLSGMAPMLKIFPAVHSRVIFRFILPFLGLFKSSQFIKDQFTVENIDLEEVKYAAYNAVSNVPTVLVRQFADWIANGTWRSVDQQTIYAERFGAVTVPMLFVAGGGDRLAPVSVVEHAFENSASGDKKLIIASRANGFADDYGHDDLVLGVVSKEEIFDPVLAWIEERIEK